MYITCEKPCYQVPSKNVPFRPRWAAHASPALRTRTDYQSVGLQLHAYPTWHCILSSIVFSPKSSNTFEQVVFNITRLFILLINHFSEKIENMRKHDWRSFSLRALESFKDVRSVAVNSRSFTFFQLTSSRRMWKSTKKKKRSSQQKLRVSAHSAARYATIIPSLANPLFSLQPLEGSFAIRAPSTWRCGIMVYGRSPTDENLRTLIARMHTRRLTHNPVAIFRTQSRSKWRQLALV